MKVTFQITLDELCCPDIEAAKLVVSDFIKEGMIGITPDDITIISLEPEEWEKESV